MPKKETYDASSISVLEGLEAVRKRPGMYIGSTSRKGLNHLIYEIVDNAVDEHLAGYCDTIHVTLEADGSATVTDNGRGIPVGMHEKGVPAERLVFTTLHAGGKFDNNAYKTSGGLHGVGSSVVNALSTYLDVQVSLGGWVYHDRYERGVAVQELDEDGLLPKIGKTKNSGTRINFLPDPEIFEKTRFSATEVKSRLHETAYLNPELTMTLPDYQTACGCTDILMHTLERYFTNGGNMEITDSIAEGLMRTVIENARILINDPKNYDARAEVMWAGSLSHNGLTGCGAVVGGDFASHALEHEIGGLFDVAHGAGLAAIWGSWARYVYKDCLPRFEKFAMNVMRVDPEGTADDVALRGIEAIEDFFRELKMPTSIHELGIDPTDEELKLMAHKCSIGCKGSKGSAKVLHEEDMYKIYKAAL